MSGGKWGTWGSPKKQKPKMPSGPKRVTRTHLKTSDGVRCQTGTDRKFRSSEDPDSVDCKSCLGLLSGDKQANFRACLNGDKWKNHFKKSAAYRRVV